MNRHIRDGHQSSLCPDCQSLRLDQRLACNRSKRQRRPISLLVRSDSPSASSTPAAEAQDASPVVTATDSGPHFPDFDQWVEYVIDKSEESAFDCIDFESQDMTHVVDAIRAFDDDYGLFESQDDAHVFEGVVAEDGISPAVSHTASSK